ncbi:MAG: hypothetical protein K1X53_08905 [Candidatus Sumerlaeaceae bacterium]|nr:hypothetical protein [Candidatus Sumerlaeaceae bacterium]
MAPLLVNLLISFLLFVALLIALEVGRRIGKRKKVDKDGLGTGASDGVVFAVFGLIAAFTFSTATSRFNDRRELIVEQANALGTAHLRLDALDPADRTEIRQHMLHWVELSQRYRDVVSDSARLSELVAEGDREQAEVWRLAGTAVEKKNQPALWSFVMSPLNDWIDLTTKRNAVSDLGTPTTVLVTLIALSLVTATLAGFNSSPKPRSRLHTFAFAGIIALLVFVMLDMKSARSGLIRVDSLDHILEQVGQGIRAQLQ